MKKDVLRNLQAYINAKIALNSSGFSQDIYNQLNFQLDKLIQKELNLHGKAAEDLLNKYIQK